MLCMLFSCFDLSEDDLSSYFISDLETVIVSTIDCMLTMLFPIIDLELVDCITLYLLRYFSLPLVIIQTGAQ